MGKTTGADATSASAAAAHSGGLGGLEPGYSASRLAQFEGRSEYREVEFDGARWPFFVNGFGLKRTQEATGKDVQAMLYQIMLTQSQGLLRLASMEQASRRLDAALKKAGQDDAALRDEFMEQVAVASQAVGFTSNMEAYAAYFYAGTVSFYPEMTFDDVLLRLTPTNMVDLEPLVAEQLARLLSTKDKAETGDLASPNGQADDGGGERGQEGN